MIEPRKGLFCFIIEVIPCGNQSSTPAFYIAALKEFFMPNDKNVDKPSEADFYKNIVSNLPSTTESSWMWFGLATAVQSKVKKRGRK